MWKKLNLFVLAVLLLSQTLLTPISSTYLVAAESNNEQTNEEESETKVDKQSLEQLLENVATLDEEEYTKDSYATFLEIVKDAEEVLEDNDASQDEVNEAINLVEDAEKNLVVEEDESDTSTNDDEAEADDSDENEAEKEAKQSDSEDFEKTLKYTEQEKSKQENETNSNNIEAYAEVNNDYFDFNISEIKDIDGNPYTEDNPYRPGDEFWVGVD